MGFTLLVISENRTKGGTWSARLRAPVLWALVLGVVLAPIAAFWLGYDALGPAQYKKKIAKQQQTISTLEADLDILDSGYQALQEERTRLAQSLEKERQARAAAETEMAISTNAQSSSSARMEELEAELMTLRNQVKLYESFLKPTDAQMPVQCYNMSINPVNDAVAYALTFLKADNKDKSKLNIKVKFNILHGTGIMDLDEIKLDDADRVRDEVVQTSRRLTGRIRTEYPKEGLRMLDVKAYNKEDELVAHCWKAF